MGEISTAVRQNWDNAYFKAHESTVNICYQYDGLDVAQPECTCAYLHAETIQKMIKRLLTEGEMSKEKLAEKLGITVENVKRLCSKKIPSELISKINLPLIKLYCKARF